MATFAVGDVHGNVAALEDVLQQLRAQVTKGDVVVFLGDYIDRGAGTRGCIDAILAFRDAVAAETVCLRGNHEDWMLRTMNDFNRHSWLLGMEAMTTIRSYSTEAEQALRDALGAAGLQLYLGKCALPYDKFFEAMPAAHRAFLAQLALSIETADCICTHGGVDPSIACLRDQPASSLIWGHATFPSDYRGQTLVVYGHHNNAVVDEAGWPHPRVIGNTIGIDTISHGVLTAIKLPERKVIQSRKHQQELMPCR